MRCLYKSRYYYYIVGPEIDGESEMFLLLIKKYSEVAKGRVKTWSDGHSFGLGVEKSDKLDRRPADVYARNLQPSLRVAGINKTASASPVSSWREAKDQH